MQSVYNANILNAYPGMRAGIGDLFDARTLVNDLGSTRKTVDVDATAVNGYAYLFRVAGFDIAHTGHASAATEANVRDGIIAAARAIRDLESIARFNPNGNDVRVSAVKPGTDFTIATVSSNLALSTVQAHVASQAIPFGRGIVRRTGAGTNDKSGGLPVAEVAKVITITVSGATNDKLYSFMLNIPGYGRVLIEYLGDSSATIAEVCAGLEARVDQLALAGLPVTATSTGTTVVLTSTQPGVDFTVEDADAQFAPATTTAAVANIWAGVLERTPSIMDVYNADPNNLGEAAPYMDMTVVSRGPMWVEVEQAVTADVDPVYCRFVTGSGGTVVGKFRKDSDSGTAALWPYSKWRTSTSGQGRAILNVNIL